MADRFEEQLTQDFVLIMGALADQRDATRALARAVDGQRETGLEQKEVTHEIQGTLVRQQEVTHEIQGTLVRQQGVLLQLQELLRQQQELLGQQQEQFGVLQSTVERHDSILTRQVELFEEQAVHLAQCQASIDRAEVSLQSLHGHLLEVYGQQKRSKEALADHESRITALERRQPPAA